jgi:hypothetical protein
LYESGNTGTTTSTHHFSGNRYDRWELPDTTAKLFLNITYKYCCGLWGNAGNLANGHYTVTNVEKVIFSVQSDSHTLLRFQAPTQSHVLYPEYEISRNRSGEGLLAGDGKWVARYTNQDVGSFQTDLCGMKRKIISKLDLDKKREIADGHMLR